ncbi:MAG: DNA polymerase I [Rickettsiaceae bacterium]|nr:DNA polymerase I [Rickettsiaceae bacterium]
MKKCLIIDSYGFIFRAFYVQPSLTNKEGESVGAIYGFSSMLLKLLQEQKPTHVVAVFDTGGPNFRHKIYPEYKSNRPQLPQELISQFPLTRHVAEAFNLMQAEVNGYEADDVIASIARCAQRAGEEVVVVSADKDLAQLMSEGVKIFDPMKGKTLSAEDIYDKFGVEPAKIRDVLALRGDSSDNIPGVPGFGPKTAAELIAQFGSFDELCKNYDQIKSPRKKQIFQENIEKAKLSYELVRLEENIDLNFQMEDALWQKPPKEKLLHFIEKHGFKSLTQRAIKLLNDSGNSTVLTPEKGGSDILRQSVLDISGNGSNTPKNASPIPHNLEDILIKNGWCSIYPHHDSMIIYDGAKIYHHTKTPQDLSSIMQNDAIQKILYDSKELYKHFDIINSYDDISLLAYVLGAGQKKETINSLFIKHTKIEAQNPEEICANMHLLRDALKTTLFEEKTLDLYLSIDLPISRILAKIEKNGVLVDSKKLHELSKEFELELTITQKKIFEIAGREFNIGSPKQLGEVLFEELKLPAIKKTGKSEALSTSAEILEDLASNGYEIASCLLYWRQISKLKNTYSDTLPKMVNPQTGRIHTTFSQTTTATGRLSSHEPNLQNIPVRTQEGEKIRNSFIAPKNHVLICADYSQVELRILAEIANIPELREAFIHGEDIHAKTASQIFGISLRDVTPELRRKAKAINFGIIYGISPFGLSKQLGITRIDAAKYIEKYFSTYPGISEYMRITKEFADKHGYVVNEIGRRCYLPQIHSKNFAEKSFAQRAAINAPIQGYASDIIKISMIEIDKIITERNLSCKMILQIHDELVFECPDSELDQAVSLIKKAMENAVTFNPHLKVNIEISSFWS